MKLMLLGNTGSGKSTFAERLASRHGFIHINTGKITRMMHQFGCHNLPILVQAMIETIDECEDHVFDHFYMHTYDQLTKLFGKPVVIEIIDKRVLKSKVPNMDKYKRYLAQYDKIQNFLEKRNAEIYKVYNTDYGFDVSELINAGILEFNSFAMEMIDE